MRLNLRTSRPFWICLLLLAVIAVAYYRIGWADFVNLDDPNYFKDNPKVLAGLTWGGMRWAFTTFHFCNWHPLTWMSYMVDVSLFGKGPLGPHLENVALHGANSLFLFLLLRKMTGATWRSAIVAALFAIHPLHVESVAWISERKDLLSTLFTLATLHAYLEFVQTGARKAMGRALGWYALALMAKPMPVSLPILLLLLDRWPLHRTESFSPLRNGKLILEKWPFAAMAAVSCLLTVLAQKHAIVTLATKPLVWRILNAAWAYLRYLADMVWPRGLQVIYPLAPFQGLLRLVFAGLLSALALAVATWFLAAQRERRPYLLVGWLWFLVSLVPVIGLVQVGSQAMADRYTYVPLLGPFIMVAWGAGEAAERWRVPFPFRWATAMGLIVSLMALTWVQVGYWRNSITLFQHAIAVDPVNPLAFYSLGQVLAADLKFKEAVPYLEEARLLAGDWAPPRRSLAYAYYYMGEKDKALSMIKEGLQLNSGEGELLYLGGRILIEKGQKEEAVGCLRQFLAMEPQFLLRPDVTSIDQQMLQEARVLLGLTARNLKWPKEASRVLEQARQRDPGNPIILLNLGLALDEAVRPQEALMHLRHCGDIQRKWPLIHLHLGLLLRKLGDPAGARAELSLTLCLDPGNAEATRVLKELK